MTIISINFILLLLISITMMMMPFCSIRAQTMTNSSSEMIANTTDSINITISTMSGSSSTTTYTLSNFVYGSMNLDNTFIQWITRGSQIDFYLTSPLGLGVTSSFAWLGVGFNSLPQMNSASAIICILANETTNVFHYFNQNYDSNPLDANDTTIGISNAMVASIDGNLTCAFTRDSTNAFQNYFNLVPGNQVYLISAFGMPTPDGSDINQHVSKAAAASTVDFYSNNSSTTPAPSTTTAGSSQTAGSFSAGVFKVTWTRIDNTSIQFYLTASTSATSNAWIAIGFSYDQLMGSDDVIACVYSDNIVTVARYYNEGNEPVYSNSSNGVSNGTVTLSDGQISCSVRRLIQLASDAKFYSLDSEYYLLASTGLTDSSGDLQYHGPNRVFSNSEINFLADSSSSGQTTDPNKVKAHSCIMIFAWAFCASTGMLIARHFKFMLPSTKLCGLKIWFVIHRPLMIFVAISSITAFIVILANLNWQWVSISTPLEFSHSIIGIVAIGLSVIQVLVAFIRPHPDAKYRFIFNHFHRTVGVTTFVLAITAMFIGVNMQQMNLGRLGWLILIGWLIWILIVILLIEIFSLLLTSNGRADTYKLDSPGISMPRIKKHKRAFNVIKSILLVLHLIIALGLSVSLIVIISVADNPDTFATV